MNMVPCGTSRESASHPERENPANAQPQHYSPEHAVVGLGPVGAAGRSWRSGVAGSHDRGMASARRSSGVHRVGPDYAVDTIPRIPDPVAGLAGRVRDGIGDWLAERAPGWRHLWSGA